MIPAAAAAPRPARDRLRRTLKVVVVDDSVVARAVLGRMVGADAGLEVAGEASGAQAALAVLRRVRADVILLDVEMPETSGLQILPELLREGRGARVLVVSSLAEEGAAVAVEALRLGAADTLPKPGGGRLSGTFSRQLLEKIHALGPAHDVPSPVQLPVPRRPRAAAATGLSCLAIGASTGGLHALAALFEALPERIGAPILVTQHLPAVFMPFFARQLARSAKRDVAVAGAGALLRPDQVLVAPGDAHLRLTAGVGSAAVFLDRADAPCGCLPAVDPMLASVGDVFGAGSLGVVLTGMGRDGLEGARALVAAGGSVIVQDQATSTVWGMPRAIAEAGLACEVLPPAKIARRIAERVTRASVAR